MILLLDKVKVKNFKAVSGIELSLSYVNVLVGSNGSGKSSMLQAIHLACCAMRQAKRVELNKTTTVGVEDLDYLPTEDYRSLGHINDWGKNVDSPSSETELYFSNPKGPYVTWRRALCEIRSARNAGISVTGDVDQILSPLLKDKTKFFSSYIPGISGIPNKEEKKSKKVILKACSFGDSNVILRNALLLLQETKIGSILAIEKWIEEIIGPIKITVSHNADNDLYIKCFLTINGHTKPIELAGTGYIQLIQIFCYILLFSPGVLLVDEPDIHLHPDVQERLVSVLIQIAREQNMRIIITTHSPFIVRGAPSSANLYWLNDGKIQLNSNREAVELALGWGAFGKKILFISEDSKSDLLKSILRQWPGLERAIAYLPGQGYKSIPTPSQAQELSISLGGNFKLMIHRDRDSLTDNEVAKLKKDYADVNVELWFPVESDIEAYFCQENFLEFFLSCTKADAKTYIDDAYANQAGSINSQFSSQRAAHNAELHKAGGSPSNNDVWAAFQNRPLKGAKGKTIFNRLQNSVPKNKFRIEAITTSVLNGNVALDLKHNIENVLAK